MLRRFHTLLTVGLCLVALACASCADGWHIGASRSAYGVYADSLDTVRQQQQYARLLQTDSAKNLAAHVAVARYYREALAAGAAPIWYDADGLSPDAEDVLRYLCRAIPAAGLDSAAFRIPQLLADCHTIVALRFDSVGQNINDVLARFDYNLSCAYVRYAVGQRFGFMQPARVFNHLLQKPEGEYARLFDYDVAPPDYAAALEALSSDSRLDFLEESEPSDTLYHRLSRLLAQTADTLRRHTLAANMERCRWQMARPNAREALVLVNLAAQTLWAVRPDSIFDMRICCGALATKTPLLHSRISYMQVNPDWLIPLSIIKNEISHHATDSAYFARHRYYIVDRASGDTLNPALVSAERMQAGGLRIGQSGGRGNSLGRIVFRFPNKFDVYLHDTNSPGAFQRERRTVSHGCIRVEKPFALAQYLLPAADEWTLDRLRISMDMAPTSERGRKYLSDHANDQRPFRLVSYLQAAPAVPLFIIYATAYPSPYDGSMEYWPDIYGYDAVIAAHVPLH